MAKTEADIRGGGERREDYVYVNFSKVSAVDFSCFVGF
jgi:hypothetical protein